MDERTIMFSIVTALLTPPAKGLIGYDYGGHGLNIMSLSLLDIGNCNLEDIESVIENIHVQLFQLSDVDRTRVIQCKIEVAYRS